MSFWRSGNVLFLILIAVALFAALSYAVTQATGGGVIDISAEKSDLDTAKQQSIQANIDGALWRLKLVNGCRDNEISYETPAGDNENPDAPTDNTCHVYHPAGGGVPYIPLDGGGEDPECVLTDLAVGEDCDGVVYAGLFSGNRLYTTPADQGPANWAGAPAICDALGADWYLPTEPELNILCQAQDNIGGFTENWHWSATEVNGSTARRQNFSSCNAFDTGKSTSMAVRCIRRD